MTKIQSIILAAGLSRRMKDVNKLLITLGDKALIEHVVENALSSATDGVTVVVGNEREKMERVLRPYKVQIVDNPYFTRGMSTSIVQGVRQVRNEPDIRGVLIFHGDMPFIRPATINRVINEYEESFPPVTVPVFAEKRGHPVLFDRRLFAELSNLSGDKGARSVLKKYEASMHRVEVKDGGILLDIDNEEDYERAKRMRVKK